MTKPSKTPRKHAAKPARKVARVSAPVSLEGRHAVCLDFMKNHGLSCDPWTQPTCGYELGIVRPMECVAP